MMIYMIVMIAIGKNPESLMTDFATLAAAALVLLPAVNRINNQINAMAYFEPFLMNVSDNLQEEINDSSISYNSEDYKKKLETKKLPVNKTISLKDITYKYPGADRYVLNHADMEVPVGKSVGIVGTLQIVHVHIVDSNTLA